MRLFVAVVPPEEAVEHLDDFLDVRRSAGPFRWASAEQFHVTLCFLAEVEERRLDDLVERLGRAAARRTAFETRIAGGGAFPSVGRARVLWAGLDLDEPDRTELTRLATGCRAAANRAGIVVDGQLTTSRLILVSPGFETHRSVRRFASGPSRRSSTFAADRGPRELGPRRLRYETVDELALGG